MDERTRRHWRGNGCDHPCALQFCHVLLNLGKPTSPVPSSSSQSPSTNMESMLCSAGLANAFVPTHMARGRGRLGMRTRDHATMRPRSEQCTSSHRASRGKRESHKRSADVREVEQQNPTQMWEPTQGRCGSKNWRSWLRRVTDVHWRQICCEGGGKGRTPNARQSGRNGAEGQLQRPPASMSKTARCPR